MIEKYYAGDPRLEPRLCYELCLGDTDQDYCFATELLDRNSIRWTIWSRENGSRRIKYVLYRDRKGLVLRTK